MSQPTVTQIRLKNIITCLAGPVNCLKILAETLGSPLLAPISNTAESLLIALQSVRHNKEECVQLTEKTYGLLYAIISLYAKSESGDLPLSLLKQLTRFTETLHKIHTYVEAQQSTSKIKQLFRQGEMSALLKGCKSGLQEGLDAFNIQDFNLLKDATEMKEYAGRKHKEVLELIEAISEGTISDKASSINKGLSPWHASSKSISMLPSDPKIFHGREAELSQILNTVKEGKARVAILGAGGMGKTSLARAVLHHPQITTKYGQHCFFVVCDTVSTKIELAALLGAHLGLQSGIDLTRPVV
ncbi:hypothetical protein C8R43DRAFT_1115463, partial [Mycena crocata]